VEYLIRYLSKALLKGSESFKASIIASTITAA
jgi:hypothetical protein